MEFSLTLTPVQPEHIPALLQCLESISDIDAIKVVAAKLDSLPMPEKEYVDTLHRNPNSIGFFKPRSIKNVEINEQLGLNSKFG